MLLAPTVAVFAGGASRRMGADKALLTFEGESFLARAVHAARDCGLDVIVVGRSRDERIEGVDDWIEDEEDHAGPLVALRTALRAALRSARRELLVVACDMPLLDPATLRWLASRERAPGVLAIVTRSAAGIEPLFARYSVDCLEHVDALIANGERSIRALAGAVSCAIIDAPESVAGRLVNVNTREELAALCGRPLPGLP